MSFDGCSVGAKVQLAVGTPRIFSGTTFYTRCFVELDVNHGGDLCEWYVYGLIANTASTSVADQCSSTKNDALHTGYGNQECRSPCLSLHLLICPAWVLMCTRWRLGRARKKSDSEKGNTLHETEVNDTEHSDCMVMYSSARSLPSVVFFSVCVVSF